jgi:hypothetical protein
MLILGLLTIIGSAQDKSKLGNESPNVIINTLQNINQLIIVIWQIFSNIYLFEFN